MKHLLVYRHAKSSWSDEGLSDFDRPLNARGRGAAGRMALYMSKHMPLSDLILCSSAQRTRETVAPLIKAYRHDYRLEVRREFYLAPPSIHLSAIQTCPKEVDCLMVVAHNPGLEELVAMLVGQGEPALRKKIAVKFATACVAQIDFNIKDWAELAPGQGTLSAFVTPKDEVTFSL